MKEKIIITISRQFASGGRAVAERLSEDLSIPFYDKDLISLAAKKSGFSEQLFEKMDEKPSSSLLYSLSMGSFMLGGSIVENIELPLNDKVFLIQTNIIREIAKEGSCIIVGRCADYVLREDPFAANVFISSGMKTRIKNASSQYDMPTDKLEALITKTDKKRASYYNYYTGMKWGMAENYHLCLNADGLGVSGCVELIKNYIDRRFL